uniref:hypothetical protein n=1 Tax=Aquisalimonas sp. TaxID=1872621 RepID=UPI0025BB0937
VDENGEPTFDPDTGSVTDAPRTGPFLYDYERRDPSRLGGHAGTAVEPSGCDNSGVQGAEAWSNPDWMDALPAWSSPDRSTVVRVENGRDVIYHSRTSLQRIEIDTSGAVISMNSAGSFLQGHTGMHVAEIIDVGDRRAFVQFTGRHPSSSGLISHLLKYWDITDFPTTYGSQVVNAADVHISSQHYTHADGDRPDWPDGPHASEEGSNPGMAWDTYRRKLVLWNGSKRLYELIPPQTLATTGWELADYVTDPLAADGQFPVNPVVSGRTRFVLGHFHYDRGWDVYLGLEKNSTNLWLFKPQDWSPSAGNDEGRRVWAPSVDRVGDRLWETTLE